MLTLPRCLLVLGLLAAAPLAALTTPQWLRSLDAGDHSHAGGHYGTSVAADGGSRVAVGEPQGLSGSVPAVDAGAAEVWRVQGSTLIREARLTPPGALDQVERFGSDVALSGRWLAVAAGSRPPGDPRAANVHLYRRDSGTWILAQTLALGSDHAEETSVIRATPTVALSGDWLAIGRPGWSSGSFVHIGEVQLYRLQGESWQAGPVLHANDAGAWHGFGHALAFGTGIASEPLLAVGAPLRNGIRGAVYLFRRHGSDWQQEQRVLPPSGGHAEEASGFSVALLAGTLAIGAPGYSVIEPAGGRVLIWRRRGEAGTPWLFEAQFGAHPEPVAGDQFGFAVALRNHSSIVVSAPFRTVPHPTLPVNYSQAGIVQRFIRAWALDCSWTTWGILETLPNPPLWLTLSQQRRGQALSTGPGLLAIGWPGRSVEGSQQAGVAEIRRFDRILRAGFNFASVVC